MSAISSFTPALASLRASRVPTCPAPSSATVRPFSSRLPKRRSQQARIAASTPRAVNGLGSPLPPRAFDRPVTCSVPSAIVAMSVELVPTSSAVT